MNSNSSGRRPSPSYSQRPRTPSLIESLGPEGKIRGNASQLVERYMALGRDAMRDGDMVNAEGFFQHAEHYRRMMLSHARRMENEAAKHSTEREEADGQSEKADSLPQEERSQLGAKNSESQKDVLSEGIYEAKVCSSPTPVQEDLPSQARRHKERTRSGMSESKPNQESAGTYAQDKMGPETAPTKRRRGRPPSKRPNVCSDLS